MAIVEDTVLGILSAGTVEGNVFRLTCGQLDRKTYEAVNKVLDNLGGRWDRRAKGHIFAFDNPADVIDQVILTGEIGQKNALEFFETPAELARQLVETADLRAGQQILEPSAGLGAIVDAIPTELHPCVTMIELDPGRQLYLAQKYGRPCIAEDFLTYQPLSAYDRIVMNPPFSKGREVQHVTHAYEMLAPSGRLVAIMSNSITFRTDGRYSAMRSLIDAAGFWRPNPAQSFKGSGTGVNTVTVVLDK